MNEYRQYDAIVVGGGPVGAHAAKKLSEAKKTVLLLEAGRAGGLTYEGYRSYVDNYYTRVVKDTNSPYPYNMSAPSPNDTDILKIVKGTPDMVGYQVEVGKEAFGSTYLRQLGGTSLHWLGTTPRFVPHDFQLQTRYGVGIDWPLTYADLQDYYCEAEWSIGVSANRKDQEHLGVWFPKGYDYPMERIPPSYSDQVIAQKTDGLTVNFAGKDYPLLVSSLAQARNSIPRKSYTPVGAVGAPDIGQRCEGNSACIPICPVQAKYSALKTIAALDPNYVTVVTQAVVTRLTIGENGRISGVEYIRYETEGALPPFQPVTVTAGIYVLAGHAVENAKLLLASGAANSSDQVGRNLMDHPFSFSWALAPQSMGSFRGPLQTSGIESLRDGEFRKYFAAFRVDLGNTGWDIVDYPPDGNVTGLLAANTFGKKLRRTLAQTLPHQVRIGFDIEQLPDPNNRVTISREFKDAIGCFRPIISYDLSDYTWQAMVESQKVSKAVYDAMGIPASGQNFWFTNDMKPDERKFRAKDGKDYLLEFVGAGHHIGTHRMGTTRGNSVVDSDQRSWDHENLYVVGCGSFPTTGTANPTLTAIALTLRSTKAMLTQLQ
ncbi:MAG: GMC family oxidoreductase [Gemmatimonadaceae bacterium]